MVFKDEFGRVIVMKIETLNKRNNYEILLVDKITEF